MKGNTRENQFDLLRLLAVAAVMMIHTAGIYIGRIESMSFEHTGALAVMDTATTVAVPCFIMLSGAFTIGNDQNDQFAVYYRKIWKKLGVPALVFTVIYTIISIPLAYLGTNRSDLLTVLKNTVSGLPFYHMWYVYMMIGVYLVSPVFVMIRKAVGEQTFGRMAVVLFVLCGISLTTGTHLVQWDIAYSIGFTGYYVMGYVLREKAKPGNLRAFFWILLAALILGGESWLRFLQLNGEISEEWVLTGSASPAIMIASLCLFYGFACMRCRFNAINLIRDSYLMYLLHGGVLSLITGVIYLLDKTEALLMADVRITVPVITITNFLLSWLFARIISSVIDMFHRKNISKSGF